MRKFVMRTAPLLMALCVTLVTGCGSSVSEKTQLTATGTYENSALLVSTSELAAAIGTTNQVIIDVRSAADYSAGHIRNAVNLPVGTFDKGTTTNNFDLGKLDITVGYKVTPAWGLEASYTPALYGQNTAAGATYSLAVFYKTP